MTDDRRNPAQLDRRTAGPSRLGPHGGRRHSDPDPSHGTRTRYQRGCRCLPCRSANATYEAEYRDRKRRGLPLPGALVRAVDTWRYIRVLRREYDTESSLAHRLGYADRHIQIGRVLIRHETAAKIRRIYDIDIMEAGIE